MYSCRSGFQVCVLLPIVGKSVLYVWRWIQHLMNSELHITWTSDLFSKKIPCQSSSFASLLSIVHVLLSKTLQIFKLWIMRSQRKENLVPYFFPLKLIILIFLWGFYWLVWGFVLGGIFGCCLGFFVSFHLEGQHYKKNPTNSKKRQLLSA